MPPCFWFDLPNAPAVGQDLGMRDDIPDGGARMIALDSGAGLILAMPANPATSFRLILLRSGNDVVAYVNRCAHFGVPLANKLEHLILKPHVSVTCNVHYARYRWRDGYCESGECEGESLLTVPIIVTAEGRIKIAASQI